MSEREEEGAGRDGDEAGRSDDAARGEAGRGGADVGGPDQPHQPRQLIHAAGLSRLPTPVRIAISILGPLLLTTGYFVIPFDALGPRHPILPWVIVTALLTLLAIGMVLATNRALTYTTGRYRHPGLGILLMSWSAILVFAAGYWAMATRHGQFVGLQTRLDALYFTGVTMATVGYGDVHPSGQVARAVVLVQLVYTLAFLVGGVTAVRTRARARMMERASRG